MRNDGWIQLRVSGEERIKTDAFLAGLLESFPLLNRTTLLRAALRLGLAELEKNPRKALHGAISGKV